MGRPLAETVIQTLPAWGPFPYGWVYVPVAAVAMSATRPGRTYALGPVKGPLRAGLDIPDERFARVHSCAIIGSAVVLPAD